MLQQNPLKLLLRWLLYHLYLYNKNNILSLLFCPANRKAFQFLHLLLSITSDRQSTWRVKRVWNFLNSVSLYSPPLRLVQKLQSSKVKVEKFNFHGSIGVTGTLNRPRDPIQVQLKGISSSARSSVTPEYGRSARIINNLSRNVSRLG